MFHKESERTFRKTVNSVTETTISEREREEEKEEEDQLTVYILLSAV